MKKIVISLICLIIFAIGYKIFTYSSCDEYVDLNTLNSKEVIPWGVKDVINPKLMSKYTGKGIKIAILDSGIDFNHPDFGGNIQKGYNVLNPSALPIDDYGHGTLVAGIIAAQNNKFGIVGIAPEADVYPVKVLDGYGEGNINDIVKGIDWCINNKIQIINMSFAILDDKPMLSNSIKKAIDSNIIIIASANNSYGGEVGYPASYDDIISVTAVDCNHKIAESAPVGKIDFCSPGVNILTTNANDGYSLANGTSLSTAYITALTALILQNPADFELSSISKCSQKDVYTTLKKLSKHLGGNGKNSTFGEGFVSIN